MNFNQEERKQKLLYLQRDNGNGTMGHYNLLLIGIFIFFMIIMGRVWYLQVIKYDYFKELSEKNRIHKREIKAPRGIIFDRNGKIVADNRPQFIARYTNPIQGISDESINKLSSILGIDIEQLNKRISEASYTPLKSITLKEDLNRKAVAVLKENNFLFSGVTVETEPIRYYNFAGVGAHVIGHMGKLTKEDIHRVDGSEYCIDDWIGKTGIERVHE
ncbi:MAG: hypothetical protein SVW57_02245, partial [Thermodesulfobacteriota bacterium]|nr:hypothetical protein [Thermodesulfobacteriota bacterium]